MKTIQPKYEEIWDPENLHKAFKQVASGRNDDLAWTKFAMFESEIIDHLCLDLMWETYMPGSVSRFSIRDPKPRDITAPRFYDRIAQIATCSVVDRVFDSKAHRSSFACRAGSDEWIVSAKTKEGKTVRHKLRAAKDYPIGYTKAQVKRLAAMILSSGNGPVNSIRMHKIQGHGTLYACVHYQELLRSALGKWGKDFQIVSIDIKSFFASISHSVLKKLLDDLFEDKRIVKLLYKFLDVMDDGLAIGFPLSQPEANLIGSCFDYFITDTLGFPYYIRYMDDMRILVHTREEAKAALAAIDDMASEKLCLRLSEKKTTIKPFKGSDIFCGFCIHPHYLAAKQSTLKRHERRCLKKERMYLSGQLALDKLKETSRSAEDYMDLTGAKSEKIAALKTRIQSYTQFCPKIDNSLR